VEYAAAGADAAALAGLPMFGAPCAGLPPPLAYPAAPSPSGGGPGTPGKRKHGALAAGAPPPLPLMAGLPSLGSPLAGAAGAAAGAPLGGYGSPLSAASEYCSRGGAADALVSTGGAGDPAGGRLEAFAVPLGALPEGGPGGLAGYLPATDGQLLGFGLGPAPAAAGAAPGGLKAHSFCAAPRGGEPGARPSPFAAAAAGAAAGLAGLPDPELFAAGGPGCPLADLLSDDGEGSGALLAGAGSAGGGPPRAKRARSAPASAALPDLEDPPPGAPSLMAAAGAWMDALLAGGGAGGSLGLDDPAAPPQLAAPPHAAPAQPQPAAAGAAGAHHQQQPHARPACARPQALDLGALAAHSAPALGGSSPSPSPSPAPTSALRLAAAAGAARGGCGGHGAQPAHAAAAPAGPAPEAGSAAAVDDVARGLGAIGGAGAFGPPSATAASWAPSPHGGPGGLFGRDAPRHWLGMGMAPPLADCASAAATPRAPAGPDAACKLPAASGSDGGARGGSGRERSSIASGATTDGIFVFGAADGFLSAGGGSSGGGSAPYCEPPGGASYAPAKAHPGLLHPPPPRSRLGQAPSLDCGAAAAAAAAAMAGAPSLGCCVGDLLLDPACSWGEDLELPPQHMELLEDMLRP
jgi:hypothetical protein